MGNPLSIDDTKRVLYFVANALQFLEKCGICHRGINPENILLHLENDNIDLALLTEMSQKGDAMWAAPEEIFRCCPQETLGHPSDVWAIGLVAFFMRTRRLLTRVIFQTNDPSEKMWKKEDYLHLKTIFKQELTNSKSEIGDEKLFIFILHCLEFEPNKRIKKEHMIRKLDYVPTKPLPPLPKFPHNEYQFLKPLGRGGFGSVLLYNKKSLKTTDSSYPNEVALKIFTNKTVFDLEKRNYEIIANKSLLHRPCPESIVQCYGQYRDQEESVWGLYLKYCDTDLEKYMKQENVSFLSINDTNYVLYHVMTALQFLEQCGICHRDIKPGNILLCLTNNHINLALITDFGLSRMINKTEVELTMAGTPNWAAPEVLLPSLKDPKPKKALHGHPSDVWGVGLLALYMRTRKHPTFTLNKDELKFQLETFIQDLDKSRTSINDENLFTFIKQCLKLEPKERIRKENLLLEFDYEPPTPTNDIGKFVYNNTYI